MLPSGCVSRGGRVVSGRVGTVPAVWKLSILWSDQKFQEGIGGSINWVTVVGGMSCLKLPQDK